MFLENVKHIMKIDGGKAFDHILRRIRETGYEVDIIELSPHQLGVPQQRERVVFTCVRRDIYKGNVSAGFKIPNTPIDVDRIFEQDQEKTAKYRISKEDEAILEAWDEMVQVFETGESMSPTILCNEFYNIYSADEFAALPDWKQEYITKNRHLYEKYKAQWDAWYKRHETLIKRKEIYGKLEWQAGKKKVGDSIFNQFIQFRQSGIRVKKREYFPTLVAIVQTPIYAKERRHITPRECARLQSFPDSFVLNENDHTAYKQFGNAVNVDVVHFVISNTLKVYDMFVQ
jgi:DNA (cytosine-5)-methyltransferase 1